VAKSGAIWLVWHGLVAGNWDLYSSTSANGAASWTAPYRLTTDPTNDLAPSIVQAPDGRIWVAWHSYRTGLSTPEIFVKSYDGTSWSADKQVTFDPSFNITPSLVVLSDGSFFLIWDTDRNLCACGPTGNKINYDSIYYKYSYNNGVTWSVDNQITTSFNDSIWPNIIQTGPGTMAVAYSTQVDLTGGVDVLFGLLTTPDLAVTGVAPQVTKAAPGDLVRVYVKVENQGATNENPTATLYANGTQVNSFTFAISSGGVLVWGATWNTAGFKQGRYLISASISQAVGETDLADNTMSGGFVIVRIPDVAISSVLPAGAWVYQGNTEKVAVTAVNLGTLTSETFAVQLRVNGTSVASQTVTNLGPGASQTLTFNWATSGAVIGNYLISAYAVPIPGEVNTANNLASGPNVRVLIPGDINQDNKVNISDFVLLLSQLGTTSATWDPVLGPRCDINNDLKVDITDAVILIGHIGQTA
jgi:hypothetical protein